MFNSAFLANIFKHLNQLNLFVQGKNQNLIILIHKLAVFKERLLIWIRRVNVNNVDRLSLTAKIKFNDNFILYINNILTVLEHTFYLYFLMLDLKLFLGKKSILS